MNELVGQDLPLFAPAPHHRSAPRETVAPQPLGAEALIEKYTKGDETSVEAVRRRVAQALAIVEGPECNAYGKRLFQWAQQQGFVAVGATMVVAGTAVGTTLINRIQVCRGSATRLAGNFNVRRILGEPGGAPQERQGQKWRLPFDPSSPWWSPIILITVLISASVYLGAVTGDHTVLRELLLALIRLI